MNKESSTNTSVAGPSNPATTSSDTGVAAVAVPRYVAIRSSDTKNSSSSAGRCVCRPAKKPESAKRLNRNPEFRKAWLKEPQFRLWLQETDDQHKAKCTVCCKFLRAGKRHLREHAITANHFTNMRRKHGASISVASNAATTSIETSFAKPSNAAISSSDAENNSNADVSSAGHSSAASAITSSGSNSTFIVLAAEKVRMQTSCQAWLVYPHFEPWLQQADDPHKAKGPVFPKYVIAGQSDLQNHANSKAHNMSMVYQTEAPPSTTVKRTPADNVKVAEMTICIDGKEHDKRQCQEEEVRSTSSPSEAASTRTRRNGETPTATHHIHPIVHDHRYARIPWSMWRRILVQKKQIEALKRERHVDKEHIFRLKEQVISLKRIVNKLRRSRAVPDSGLESLAAIADINKINIKQEPEISEGSGNTI